MKFVSVCNSLNQSSEVVYWNLQSEVVNCILKAVR